MKPIKAMYVLILVIVFAAAGFYGGVMYQKSQLRATFAGGAGGQFSGRFGGGQGGFAGGQGGPGGASGMRPVSGQIVSQGNDSVTVKLTDGSSEIINLTGQTTINKTSTGAASDLKSGDRVTAIGTTNSDGSVTAQTLLIGNGMMMFRGQRNGGGPSGTQ